MTIWPHSSYGLGRAGTHVTSSLECRPPEENHAPEAASTLQTLHVQMYALKNNYSRALSAVGNSEPLRLTMVAILHCRYNLGTPLRLHQQPRRFHLRAYRFNHTRRLNQHCQCLLYRWHAICHWWSIWKGNSKPIEQIQVGEMVLARNEFEPNVPLELKRVEELFTRTSPIIELEIGGQKIGTTDEHPFYVPAREAFVPARELQVGDLLISHDGRLLRIDAIHSTLQIATVYNLRVAEYHTYFVGCDEWGWSVWAHNACVGFKTLSRRKQIEYLRDKGVEGADQLLANMTSAARNVRQGAYYQAKRVVNYYLSGKLHSIEHAANGGRVDIVLKSKMQVEAKSWWNADAIGKHRLQSLEKQVNRYLRSPDTKLRLEFQYPIPKNVHSLVKQMQHEQFGDRLTWKRA